MNFVLQSGTVTPISDSFSIQVNDSVKDSLGIQNFIVSTGKNLFDIFQPTENIRFEGVERNQSIGYWSFVTLLLIFVIFALSRNLYKTRMRLFMEAVLVPRHLKQLIREENFLIHPFSLLLFLNTILIYSLLIFQINDYFDLVPEEDLNFVFYLKIILVVGGLLIAKIFLFRITEFITDVDLGQKENRYSWLVYHQFAGIILMLPVGILLFGKAYFALPLLYLIGGSFIILFVFRIGKGILSAMGNNVWGMHLFLYLCALELIPLIVLIKVLVSQNNWLTEI